MNTEIVIPKEPSFHLPEGRYRAIIRRVDIKPPKRSNGKEGTLNAIILYEVNVPSMPDYDCLARKVLPLDLKSGSALRRFLEGLLGSGYFSKRSNQKIDLKPILEGQPCEVVLIHPRHDEEKFTHPMVDVEEMHPVTPRMPVQQPQPETPVIPHIKGKEECR